ncbi:MAG: hypothetical protein LBC03_03670 [Nitrososphaerota archaeon]|jgi:hypothetical protein|nr:hypothetical protein [Nitrososphaerota archaeon]
MLGKYENFPLNVQFLKILSSTLSSKQLQQKLIKVLKDLNRKSFHFEEISIPTIPNSEVIFEFGIAEGDCFNFLDEQETNRALGIIKVGQTSLDFFCVVRYYRCNTQKKFALKFDYYLFKVNFAVNAVEFRVFHKQGPRYIAPEELVALIAESINKAVGRCVLDEDM